MGKADPAEGLEPDITEIKDIKEREAEQLKYYGGDPIDDDEDISGLDRGDNIEPESVNEDRGDEAPATQKDAKAKADESDDEKEPAADADADSKADSKQTVADDEESDAQDGDDGDVAVTDDDNTVEPESAKDRDPGIPRHRFNEVNERMKRAEQRLAELEAQSKATEKAAENQFDFDKAEQEYIDLLLDGKTEDAAAKRREIRAAEQEVFTQKAKETTVHDINEQTELRDLQSLSLQAEESYPVFNENSRDYDPVIANKVVTYMKGYMSDGQTVSDAFVSGLADVIEQYGLDRRYGRATEQPSDEPPKPEVTKGKPINKTKEKIEAQKKAVPSPAGHGEGSAQRGIAAPSIHDMSDSDLDKLTPEQLARMRGDYVE